MEEIKAMLKATMETVIELTTRAVTAEHKAERLEAELEETVKDRDMWKHVFLVKTEMAEKLEKELKALKEKQDDSEGP